MKDAPSAKDEILMEEKALTNSKDEGSTNENCK